MWGCPCVTVKGWQFRRNSSVAAQWQLTNNSSGILISDTRCLGFPSFLYVILALYWYFQYYFILEPFSGCSFCDLASVDSLPLGSSPGFRSHCLPFRCSEQLAKESKYSGIFRVAIFHLMFTEWEALNRLFWLLCEILIVNTCMVLAPIRTFFMSLNYQSTLSLQYVLSFLFPSQDKEHMMQASSSVQRDTVLA